MEYALIGLILGLAVWFLIRRVRRSLAATDQPVCGCGGSCGTGNGPGCASGCASRTSRNPGPEPKA